MYELERRHQRYPFFGTAVLKSAVTEQTPQFTTIVNNISQGGLGLYAYAPVDKGTSVTIELRFKSVDGFQKQDILKGRVVWMANEGTLYIMGISFDEELNEFKHPNIFTHFHKVILQH